MKIILSTRNPSKAEQIKEIFEGSAIEILTLDEAGIAGEGIEDGTTLQENAFKKARFVRTTHPEAWAMADDTGLFIKHLNGAPGIKAARWAGDTATTDEITQYTLKQLEGATDRSARFETVVGIITPTGDEYFFTGHVDGTLLDAPRTKPQPKMPYSPLFAPNGMAQVWAEMSVNLENSISHRGIAFRKALAFLKTQEK